MSHICVYLEWFWDCKLSTQYNILRKTLFSIESELFFVPFSYLCAATPILSKLRYPKNDDDKIANASTNGWWRRRGPRNLRQTINHPLDTTLPRDNVTMVISYLCGFLFIVKDHKVKIEFEFRKKESVFSFGWNWMELTTLSLKLYKHVFFLHQKKIQIPLRLSHAVLLVHYFGAKMYDA